MSDRPRRWPVLAVPLLLACLSAGVQGCICYPRTYGCGYESCHEDYDDCGPRWGHEHYYEECAAEVREPEYRAPEPPPPPPRRHRRPPEG